MMDDLLDNLNDIGLEKFHLRGDKLVNEANTIAIMRKEDPSSIMLRSDYRYESSKVVTVNDFRYNVQYVLRNDVFFSRDLLARAMEILRVGMGHNVGLIKYPMEYAPIIIDTRDERLTMIISPKRVSNIIEHITYNDDHSTDAVLERLGVRE